MEKRFNPTQIRAIRFDLRPERAIAADYGVAQRVINAIRRRKTYQDVPDHPDILPNEYYVGDGLELMGRLPAGSVKGVITSPPYNKGILAKSGTSHWGNYDELVAGYADYDDARSKVDYILWQRQFLRAALRLVGKDGAVFYQTKYQEQNRLCDYRAGIMDGFPVRQVIIWDKGGSYNAAGYEPTILAPCYEVIFIVAGDDWVVPKGQARNEARKWQNLWSIKPEGKDTTGHPASFPVELARRCALLAGGPVLDPFAGSGTVGIAAERLGIPYYLFDISREYQTLFYERKAAELMDERA